MRISERVGAHEGDGIGIDRLIPYLLQQCCGRQILLPKQANHFPKDAYMGLVAVTHACPGAVDNWSDEKLEPVGVGHPVNHKSRQHLFGYDAGKLSAALPLFNVKALSFEAIHDRFAVALTHD